MAFERKGFPKGWAMERSDEFFRTLISLDNGDRIYETLDGKIVCRREERRHTVELVQRVLLGRENVAFAPEFQSLRPAWAFPSGTEVHRVVEFRNETETEPIDGAAHLVTGEPITDRTAVVYVR
ncbi:MAG: hypothetical protein ACYC96_13055 [Fimbriimonadaceae bacterium]